MNYSVKPVLATATGLALSFFTICLIVYGLQRHFSESGSSPLALPSHSPRDQVEFESGEKAAKLREEQSRKLEIFKYSENGYSQVPIERAMDYLVKHAETK